MREAYTNDKNNDDNIEVLLNAIIHRPDDAPLMCSNKSIVVCIEGGENPKWMTFTVFDLNE